MIFELFNSIEKIFHIKMAEIMDGNNGNNHNNKQMDRTEPTKYRFWARARYVLQGMMRNSVYFLLFHFWLGFFIAWLRNLINYSIDHSVYLIRNLILSLSVPHASMAVLDDDFSFGRIRWHRGVQ